MLEISLFLGIEIDLSLEKELQKINPGLFALFTNDEKYLSQIQHEEKKYLGKKIPFPIEISQLEVLSSHVLSLIKRVAPDASLKVDALQIFTI